MPVQVDDLVFLVGLTLEGQIRADIHMEWKFCFDVRCTAGKERLENTIPGGITMEEKSIGAIEYLA